MQTFVLFGHTAQPGYAGDFVALATVAARDIDSAARKLKGTLPEKRRHPDDVWFSPGKRTEPLIRRFVASSLRGMTGRRPESWDVNDHRRRYSGFLLKRLPRVR